MFPSAVNSWASSLLSRYRRKKCHFFSEKNHHSGVILQLFVPVCVWSLHRFAFVDALGSLTHPHRQQDQSTKLEDDMVVGLSLSKDGGGCEHLGGQIYRGIKRTESFLMRSPHVLLPWAHCNKSNHAHVVEFQTFPEFSPPFYSLGNTRCKGMRASTAPWYLMCTEMSTSTAWRYRGVSVQPAKAEWDFQLDIDAILSAKWKEPLLCCVGWDALKVEKTPSFSITSPKCPWVPHGRAEMHINLRCTLIVLLICSSLFTWCPATT